MNILRFFIVVLTLTALSCSDDEKKGTEDGACETGQRFNPILGGCEDVTGNNNDDGDGDNNNNNGDDNNDNNDNNIDTTGNNDADAGDNGDMGADSTDEPDMAGCETGTGMLLGKSCAPSGEPLAAADVTITGVDCDGNEFSLTTRAAGDGTYQFDQVPAGQHTIDIETGSFSASSPVLIRAGQTTDLTTDAEKVCLDQNVNIAVIGGAYDHVEGVLEQLNLQYTMIGNDGDQANAAVSFLTDLNAMMQYDIIFINCGNYSGFLSAFEFSMGQIGTALAQYVQSGKSVYTSDYAWRFIEASFPDVIDFVGDDGEPGEVQQGFAPQTITATVGSTALEQVLGRNTATIEFPQDPANQVINNNWAVPAAIGSTAIAQLTGDVAMCGEGSFSDPCPTSPDVTSGAPLLVTYKDASGGSIVYTSFHNERQATLNADMELILRFLIFQL